jgi:hypothetical protein
VKLSEPQVAVRVREEDKAEAQAVLSAAAKEYQSRTGKTVELSIDRHYLPAGPSKGGFGLTW